MRMEQEALSIAAQDAAWEPLDMAVGEMPIVALVGR